MVGSEKRESVGSAKSKAGSGAVESEPRQPIFLDLKRRNLDREG